MRRSAIAVAVTLLVLIVGGGIAVGGGMAGTAAAQGTGCEFPVTATDATGANVTVAEEPGRIVTLNPSAAQTLWEIGAKEKVVGVSSFASYLDGASSRKVVTKIQGFSTIVQVEEIIALNTDLVLAPNTISNETVERLRRANITVFRFREANSIEDVYEKTRRIGRLVGACAGADETVAWMKEEISIVREAVRGQDPPRVLYALGGGFAAGPNTFIGGLIEAAGGHNVVAEGNFTRNYPQLSGEFIVVQDPQWLVVTHQPGNASRPPRELVPNNPALRNTTAWEQGQIVAVNVNNLNQPAPRIVYPLRKMAKAFHPDAYERAAATPTPTPTPSPTPEPTATPTASPFPAEDGGGMAEPSPTATTGTESGGQPGFGVSVAVLALLVAALALRRR